MIALGGGSSMDTAKGIGVLATNPSPLKQYEGADKLGNPPLPHIDIPTTAGTGSEVSRGIIITSHEEKRKYAIRGAVSEVAILDPTVLTHIPKLLAASTGMDAVTHAAESYISVNSSPMSEMYSTNSLKLSTGNIRNFVDNRENLEAASNMLLASSLAGIPMANAGLGVVHGIAHALGGQFHIAHGVGCAIMLPACLESMVSDSVGKFAVIARIMEPEMERVSDSDCAKALPELFSKLVSDLGIETSLSKLGIKESDIEALAEATMKAGAIVRRSPKHISFDDVVQILRRSF